jgi:hypothetical protein
VRHTFRFRKLFGDLRFFPHELLIVGMFAVVRFAEVADEIWSAAIFVG